MSCFDPSRVDVRRHIDRLVVSDWAEPAHNLFHIFDRVKRIQRMFALALSSPVQPQDVTRLNLRCSLPVWSRCACVMTTALRLRNENSCAIRFFWSAFGTPWNIPQSTSTFDLP